MRKRPNNFQMKPLEVAAYEVGVEERGQSTAHCAQQQRAQDKANGNETSWAGTTKQLQSNLHGRMITQTDKKSCFTQMYISHTDRQSHYVFESYHKYIRDHLILS